MAAKGDNPYHYNLLQLTGLSGKSITTLETWREGPSCIIEIGYTGGPYYIKVRHNRLEFGGTSDSGTGTRVE